MYHVNWNTGDPQQCSKPSDCAVGIESAKHYEFAQQAAAEYEASMSHMTLPPVWTKKNRPDN